MAAWRGSGSIIDTMLAPSQANALVYSTLCGFMLIGLWAGYNTKTKREFISGVRTQSGTSRSLTQLSRSP